MNEILLLQVKDQAGKHNLQTVVENAVVLQREYKFVRKKRNVSPKHVRNRSAFFLPICYIRASCSLVLG